MEEELFNQMGLLLTQVRDARRALEDIESHTAAYAGLGFLQAVSREGAFGQPPLLNGALRVYVVNINDLSPGRTGGGILGEIFGGAGRFLGNLLGGAVGGTVSSLITFPAVIDDLRAMVEATDRIIDRLGLGSAAAAGEALTAGRGEAEAGTTAETDAGGFGAMTVPLVPLLQGLTAMFRAAAEGPGVGEATAEQRVAIDSFHRALQPVVRVLESMNHIVNGLILLVPLLTGAFASFLVRLNDVKLAIVEMLQFALRNVLLLRGIVLITVFDTLSASAELGANLLRILSTLVDRVLTATFSSIFQIAETSMLLVRNLLDGLRDTVNALLPWLLTTLNSVLRYLGNSVVFRLVYHLVDTLPNILPALHQVIHGESLGRGEMQRVQAAAGRSVPPPTARGGPPPRIAFPDLAETLLPSARVADMLGGISAIGSGLRQNARMAFDAAEHAMQSIAGSLDERLFRRGLQERIGTMRGQATRLAEALSIAQEAAAARPETGLETVADAYETWLSSGGFDQMMERITTHFQQTPTTGPEAARSIPGRVVAGAALERARATVQIDEVVIEVEPPASTEGEDASSGLSFERRSLARQLTEEGQDYRLRGARLDPLGAMPP